MYVRNSQLGQYQDENQDGLGFIATAAAIVSMAATGAKLFGGKAHYSPWNFLYDEYPRKIYEAEATIRTMTGEPLPPDPGGGAAPPGGEAYQRSMLAIVPRYVPGSEPLIAKYDRTLNEKNGAYEVTYQKQLSSLATQQGQAAPAMPAQSASSARPVSASAAYAPAPSAVPPSQYPITDGYGRVIDPKTGRVVQGAQQASMFTGLDGIPIPLLIGGAALALILLMQSSGKKGR